MKLPKPEDSTAENSKHFRKKQNPDATFLININKYKTDKQNLEAKIRDVNQKTPDMSNYKN